MSHRRNGRTLLVVPLVAAVITPLLGVAGAHATTSSALDWVSVSGAFPASPSPRSFASIAYDSNGHVVVYGGLDDTTNYNDTWILSGGSWTLSGAAGPGARDGAPMVYDPATGNDVLFGGSGPGGYLGDTEIWNGSSWTRVFPQKSPPARDGASMVYDAATGNVVLFGGYNSNGYQDDTWTWNGQTWTQVFAATNEPSPRSDAAMAYDAATGNVVLFGGTNLPYYNDTWTWNGSDWTPISPATSPPDRDVAAMVYDAAAGNVVLFGGYGDSGYHGDTWTWNGSDWTQATPTTSPSPRSGPAAVYDPATGQVILVDGWDATGVVSDTWALDSSPGAPSGVKASAGNAAATVSWSPSVTGGLALSSYNVTAKDATSAGRGGQSCATVTTTCTLSGLTNGDVYSFAVTATNSLGTSSSSAPSPGVTPRTKPSAPTITRVVARRGAITVTWRAPASNGGSSVTRFTATAHPGTHHCAATGAKATSCTIKGLVKGRSYRVVVVAQNAAGPGPTSKPSKAVRP